MDIRSINNFLNSTLTTARADNEKKTEIKSDASSERDANGQMARGQEESQKELSEEEREKVVEHLKSLPGVKDNNLSVNLKFINGKHFVLIEDPTGTVVRRVAVNELGHLLKEKDSDKGKGKLLNRAL